MFGGYVIYHKPWYTCTLCNREFASEEAILSHCKNTTRHEWCEKCHEIFVDDEALDEHYKDSIVHFGFHYSLHETTEDEEENENGADELEAFTNDEDGEQGFGDEDNQDNHEEQLPDQIPPLDDILGDLSLPVNEAPEEQNQEEIDWTKPIAIYYGLGFSDCFCRCGKMFTGYDQFLEHATTHIQSSAAQPTTPDVLAGVSTRVALSASFERAYQVFQESPNPDVRTTTVQLPGTPTPDPYAAWGEQFRPGITEYAQELTASLQLDPNAAQTISQPSAEAQSQDQPRPMVCKGCSMVFARTSGLLAHLENGSCVIQADKQEIDSLVTLYVWAAKYHFIGEEGMVYRCVPCGRDIDKLSGLFEHIESYHRAVPDLLNGLMAFIWRHIWIG